MWLKRNDPFHQSKIVCIPVGLDVINAFVVNIIDPHFTRRVNYFILFPDNAYMNNFTQFVVEKSKVAGHSFFNKRKMLAELGLL